MPGPGSKRMKPALAPMRNRRPPQGGSEGSAPGEMGVGAGPQVWLYTLRDNPRDPEPVSGNPLPDYPAGTPGAGPRSSPLPLAFPEAQPCRESVGGLFQIPHLLAYEWLLKWCVKALCRDAEEAVLAMGRAAIAGLGEAVPVTELRG